MTVHKRDARHKIIEIREVARDIYSIILEDDYIPRYAHSGQFLMVQASETTIPLLRRAISITRILDKNHYELLIQQIGLGTRILKEKTAGQCLNILGPLGSSFDINKARNKHALIVAGGIGIAPVFFLYDQLKTVTDKISVYYGSRSKEYLVDLSELNANIHLSTEDGTKGYNGYITDLLQNHIVEKVYNKDNCMVYSCGPSPMLSVLNDIAEKHSLPCEVSVETEMACGLGVCMGCPVELKEKPGHYVYACKDGPVFDGHHIVI